ncbi:hypothetical protein [Nitrosomonas sp.]|uniref:hypothetical protein n=1 Tax=Nitrosomonas sp. TaxID=42353 RepID=UPI001D27226A|nr:hypothetical protein [Nitrosomonas sp.]MBX3617425.1 hypothetical protein [Nitrosomonas sp.]
MKAAKLISLLSVLAFSLSVSSVFAVDGIDDSDHAALTSYFENQTKEMEEKLQKNKEYLEKYEAHPYYYGRQGQSFRAHTIANIHEYETLLANSRSAVEFHKKMALEQSNVIINKAQANFGHEQSAIR